MMKIKLLNEADVKALGRRFTGEDKARKTTLNDLVAQWNALYLARRRSKSDAAKASLKYVMDELERVIDMELELWNARFNTALDKKGR